MFPITIRQVRMAHSGGGKEHHLVRITRSDGLSIAIHRYNKVGAWGQCQFQRGNFAACNNFIEKKISEKEKKASGGVYEVDRDQSVQADNIEAFNRALNPQYIAALKGAGHWDYLIGGAAAAVEDEKPVRVKEAKDPEPDPSKNPNWGMF